MSKFKAGDLALIINAMRPENIGRVVTLVHRHDSDKAIIRGEMFFTKYGAPAWEVEGEMSSLLYDKIDHGFLSESCLMLLRGDFQPEQKKAKEEEPCH